MSSSVITVASVPNGASLTLSTTVPSTTSAALNAVIPPLPVTSIVAPLPTTVELSISRTERALGVPLKPVAGRKRRLSPVPSASAATSETPPNPFQLLPPSVENCHWPCAASTTSARTATPASWLCAGVPLSTASVKFAPKSAPTVAPPGADTSSDTAVSVAAPLATGASFTAVRFTVKVLADGATSRPPPTVPPSSCTRKVNDAYAAPLAFATGVKTSRPRSMSATAIVWPAPTAAPLLVKLPVAGRVAIRTARKLSAGLSPGSLNPKSARVKVMAVSSSVATLPFDPDGASLSAVTSTVSVLADSARSMPPLLVPPSSCTMKVKDA